MTSVCLICPKISEFLWPDVTCDVTHCLHSTQYFVLVAENMEAVGPVAVRYIRTA